jgi:hypothetical protein
MNTTAGPSLEISESWPEVHEVPPDEVMEHEDVDTSGAEATAAAVTAAVPSVASRQRPAVTPVPTPRFRCLFLTLDVSRSAPRACPPRGCCGGRRCRPPGWPLPRPANAQLRGSGHDRGSKGGAIARRGTPGASRTAARNLGCAAALCRRLPFGDGHRRTFTRSTPAERSEGEVGQTL